MTDGRAGGWGEPLTCECPKKQLTKGHEAPGGDTGKMGVGKENVGDRV